MTSQQHNELGNFRTPIAAAMLSGVLSGLAAIVLPRFIASLYKANNTELVQLIPFVVGIGLAIAILASPSIAPAGYRLKVRIGIAIGIFLATKYVGFYGSYSMFFGVVFATAFLSGPAIEKRSWSLFFRGMRWAIFYAIVLSVIWTTLMPYLYRPSPQTAGINTGLLTMQAIHAALAAVFMARALCVLYELRERPWVVYGAALAGKTITLVSNILFVYGPRNGSSSPLIDSQDADVFGVMSALISSVVSIVLPTIFIERQLRKEAAASTSPAAPATAPAESDASSATR